MSRADGCLCFYAHLTDSDQGNSLGSNWRAGALSQWSGGLQAGPLLLYPAASTAPHPPAMLLSPLTHAKSTIGSPGAKAAPSVSFGVQGYVEELPAGFSSAVVLIGRTGIAATQMAWGEAVRRKAATRRLTLDKDVLNSKVTYWTDNGAYCECHSPPAHCHWRTPERSLSFSLWVW